MSQLLEHILNGDYISANELFEERMVNLQEQKLYEAKRIVAAELNEVHGGKLPSEVRASPDYQGRASDILGDPTERRKNKVRPRKAAPTPKSSSSDTKYPATGSGLKPLAPKGSVRPKSLDIGTRYQKALDTAKELETRGSTGKVAKVKKLYRPYRVGRAIGKGIAKVGSGVKAALSDFGSQYGSFEE